VSDSLRRTIRVMVPLNESEARRITDASRASGLPKAQLFRTAALQVADQLIQRSA
jgi:DNA-binding IclR family transcriptional regulator